MINIGIMQGRLLPRFNNRYQAHPIQIWPSEFYIARELGFSSIEFILDYDQVLKNPLMHDEGLHLIQDVINKTNVTVNSICADYFMHAPFHSDYQSIFLKMHHKQSQLYQKNNHNFQILKLVFRYQN